MTAHTLRDARMHLSAWQPDLMLLDLGLPDGNGMALLDEPRLAGNSEVVVVTGHASLAASVPALRYGAADYIVRPVSGRPLEGLLSRVTQPSALREEAQRLSDDLQRTGRFGHLVGRSEPMKRVYDQIARVAGTSVTVLVT